MFGKNLRPALSITRHSHRYRNAITRTRRSFTSEPASVVSRDGPQEQTSSGLEAAKPTTNKPFVKNLFLGEIDTKMFIYPEVLTKEQLEETNHMVQPIEKFFLQDLDSASIDENSKIPDEVMQTVKDLGLFGQQIPQEYGGLGLNATQYARLAEITSHDGSIAVTLGAHQSIGLKGILIAGTEEQKAKYLPKLATGEHVAAFCLTEPTSGSDAASIQTKATLSKDGKHYLLSGNKIWISNGGIAEIFTVFAKTNVEDETGAKVNSITAFIVERKFGGITHGKPEDKLGIRGSNTCEVHFDNTPVPVENVLGGAGQGFKVAMNILNSGRFSMGSSGAGSLKRLINLTAEHAITRSQFGSKLKDFGLIQMKFAKLAITTYAMESMAYLAAGIIDSYEEPDASLEAAIVKVFASEGCWECVSECLQILGGLGYMRSYPYERYLRDTRIMMIFEGTNEILRLYLALSGMQHAGRSLREMLKRMKNPKNNLGYILKKTWERKQQQRKNPPMKYDLFNHVHPDVSMYAEEMEKKIIQFKFMVENYLSLHRDTIIDEQMALKRFADITIDFFAMTAVLARVSRSISIGLKNHEHETNLARMFCYEANKRIDDRLEALQIGATANGDQQYEQIADTIFKNHGWAAAHPLDRNW